jgi:hypothetical protein
MVVTTLWQRQAGSLAASLRLRASRRGECFSGSDFRDPISVIRAQCGFASGFGGNMLAMDAQWREIDMPAETARRIWS